MEKIKKRSNFLTLQNNKKLLPNDNTILSYLSLFYYIYYLISI